MSLQNMGRHQNVKNNVCYLCPITYRFYFRVVVKCVFALFPAVTWRLVTPERNGDVKVVVTVDPEYKKGNFYIAQYPVRRTDQSTVHTLFALPGRPAHSDKNSASLGSILARQQLRATTKSVTFPPLSIARYSFIQLSQLERQWRERKCPIFETVTKGDSNPGSLVCESGILPLSYRAPHVNMIINTISHSKEMQNERNILCNTNA